MEKLFDINYDHDTDLNVSFQVDANFRFLYCKPIGEIKQGSAGNKSADYLFGKICQYYFQTWGFVLILDFSEMKYEFGDRLSKSINFFALIGRNEEEKNNPILLIKPKDPKGIDSLIDWIKPSNLTIVENKEKALKKSVELFQKWID